MLDDPRINFAISKRGDLSGIDHLGLQVDSDEELKELREQVRAAEIVALDQSNAECCYARSDKYWTTDPQGVAWETFHTLDSIPLYGETPRALSVACCAPVPATASQSIICGGCCSLRDVIKQEIFNVLFLCTGNSARSIMGEAILNFLGRPKFKSFSAGSHPVGKVNPLALAVLERNNLPTQGLRSKDCSEFSGPGAPFLHFVFTVC